MDSPKRNKARLGAALLASAFAFAALPMPAAAQVAASGVYREDPAAALARHLRALAAEPKSLGALMGAGKAALQVGDPQAAITFYARAEEIAPRDGRIKAGFGSAFLAMEQPVSALKFFEEAVALGLPEADVAGERGLAYDLTGDPRRAQRDYQIALRRTDDAEVRRRLALSLAITGDRAGALAAIQPQLDAKDRAAWRTRAFVLALTGDTAGATEAVQAVMPAQALAMRPFLARLPFLNAEQRALAVHYGTMPPGSGVQMALNEAAPPTSQTGSRATGTTTDAGRPDSRQSRLGRRNRTAEPASTDSRRRPGAEEGSSTRRAERRERTAERSAQRTQTASADRAAERTPSAEAERRAQRTQTAAAEPRRSERQSNAPRQKRQFGVPMTAGSRDAPAPVRRRPATKPAEKPTQFASAEPGRTQPPVPQPQVRQPEVQPQETPAIVQPQPEPPVRDEPVQQAAPQPEPQREPAPAQAEPQPVPAENQTALAATPQNIVPQVLTPAPTPEQQTASPPAAEPQRPAVTPIDLVPSAVAEAQPSASTATPGFDLRSAGGTVTTPTPTPAPTPAPGFGAIAELVQSLPDAPVAEAKPEPKPPVRIAQADVKPTPRPAAKPASAEKKPAAKPEAKKPEAKKPEAKAAPAKKEPSRIWVQIAGGADKKALPREFTRLKAKAPKLLGTRSAWTTPLRFTNRLLVGPFKTEKEAQAFVNELNKHDFDAFSWTSPAGQEIEKLAAT